MGRRQLGSLIEALRKEVLQTIRRTDRVVLSPNPLSAVVAVKQRARPSFKPEGVWYGFGAEWLDFVQDAWGSADEYNHAYRLSVSPDVLVLSTAPDVQAFDQRFGVADPYDDDGDGYMNIRWSAVADEYAGIELRGAALDRRSWRNAWDVSSGCVWDPRGVRSILPVRAR